MRRIGTLLLLLSLMVGGVWAQGRIHLGSVDFVPEPNVLRHRGEGPKLLAPSTNGWRNVLVQFEDLPRSGVRAHLEEVGLVLWDYVGGGAFWALVRDSVSVRELARVPGGRLRALYDPKPEWVASRAMIQGTPPSWAQRAGDGLRIVLQFARNISAVEVERALLELGVQDVRVVEGFRTVYGTVPRAERLRLAGLPWVLSYDFAPPPSELENDRGRILSRASVLGRPVELGGRNLTGKGVRVGIWDANVDHHPDFGTRIHSVENELADPHGTHVAGSMMGAGLLDPLARGMAPELEAWSWNFNLQRNGLLVEEEMELSRQEHGISLSQNSYGPIMVCSEYGQMGYRLDDQNLDRLTLRHPTLLHVFAAGNSQQQCHYVTESYWKVKGYGSVLKRCKNALYVGAVTSTGAMSDFSSWGPQDDGRIFPTVCARGVEVFSTVPGASYEVMDGTSMACPTATGTLALLSQRYAQLEGGKEIRADLLRAVVANTAMDAGRPHPDFQYGFGILDGERAVQALERRLYARLDVPQGQEEEFRIKLPSGAVSLRVMLVWDDPVPAKEYPYGESILTNHLNLSVEAGTASFNPWICNPKGVEEVATRQADQLNNIQQVTLTADELSGTQEVVARIAGSTVAEGPQTCVLTWWFEPELEPRIIAPAGPDCYAPGEAVLLSADGLVPGEWSCEISYDGGRKFHPLVPVYVSEGMPSVMVEVPLPPDALPTPRAMLRILGPAGQVAQSSPFPLAPVPGNLQIDGPECSSSGWTLSWDALTGVVGYTVFMIDPEGGRAHPVAQLDAGSTSFPIPDELRARVQGRLYLSVAANLGEEMYGRRARAVYVPIVTPVKIPADGKFILDFVENPSPFFSVRRGETVQVKYLDNIDPGARSGSHMFAFSTRREQDPTFTFNLDEPFSEANARHRGEMNFCHFDLDDVPEGTPVYLHILAGFVADGAGSYAAFRVLDGETPLADVHGVSLHEAGRGPIANAEGLADYYFQLDPGRDYHLRLQYVGKEAGDLMGISFLRVEPQSPGQLHLLSASYPSSRPAMGVDTVRVALRNPGSEPLHDLRAGVSLNGAPRVDLQLGSFPPYSTRELLIPVDFSTSRALGERFDGKLLISATGVQPIVRTFRVSNLGEILAHPPSKLVFSALGVANENPRLVLDIEKPATYTDAGGWVDPCPEAQYSSLKLRPADSSMRLQVEFRELDLGNQGAELKIYTRTVPDDMLMKGVVDVPELVMRGHLEDPLVLTSHADDGAIAFIFRSDFGVTPGPGWLADIRLVPRQNTLSLLETSARGASASVPLSLTVRNNWDQPLEEVSVRVIEGRGMTRTIKYESTLDGGLDPMEEKTFVTEYTLKDGEQRTVEVFATSDLEMHDNRLEVTAVADTYCVPGPLRGSVLKPFIDRITFPGTEIPLARPGERNFIATEPRIEIFTEEPPLGLKLHFGEPAQEAMQLVAFVDWNGEKKYEAESRIDIPVQTGAQEVTLPLDASGRSTRTTRIRLIYAPATETVTPCLEDGILGSVYDLGLKIRSGKDNREGDLEVLAIRLGESPVIEPGTQHLSLTVRNNSVAGDFAGKFSAVLQLDGAQVLSQEIDWADSPLGPGQERAFSLDEGFEITAEGAHSLALELTDDDPVKGNNSADLEVLVPAEGLFALNFHTLDEQTECVDLSWINDVLPEVTPETKYTLETWLKLDAPQFSTIFWSLGLVVRSTFEMEGIMPENALALLIGEGMVVHTDENTLPAGCWNHVAITLSDMTPAGGGFPGSTVVRIFINGRELPVRVLGSDMAVIVYPILGATINQLFWGESAPGSGFNGQVKGLRLWSTARTEEQIAGNMYRYLGQEPDLVFDYGMRAGYGSARIFSSSAGLPADIMAEEELLERQDGTGMWVDASVLIGECRFEGQTSTTRISEDKIQVNFPQGLDRSQIRGRVLPLWSGTEIFYQGKALTEATVFDFREPVILTAERELFGHSCAQTLTLTYAENASSACELTALALRQAENSGLLEDLELAPGLENGVDIVLDSERGLLDDPSRVVLEYEVSPGAHAAGPDGELEPGPLTLDLRRPYPITVTAADGLTQRIYVLRLRQKQVVSLEADETIFTYGDMPVTVRAEASSGLPLSFTSTNPNVATIHDGSLIVGRPGVAILRALQPGDGLWDSASSDALKVEVKKREIVARPQIAPIRFGERLADWNFEFTTLVAERDRFLLPAKRLAQYYVIRREEQIYDGRSLLPVGEYTLEKTSPTADFSEIYSVSLESGSLQVVQGSLYRVRARVTNLSGEPISGVEVRLGAEVLWTGTDGYLQSEHGFLRPAGDYELKALAKGYQPREGRVHVEGKDLVEEIVLEPATLELRYTTAGHGLVSGVPQLSVMVARNADAPVVVAQPARYFEFESWSDGWPQAERQDVAVQRGGSFEARFVRPEVRLEYHVQNGELEGESVQNVPRGLNAQEVVAINPDPNFYFVAWDDGLATPRRQDCVVEHPARFTAEFREYGRLPGQNDFEAGAFAGGWTWRSEPGFADCPWRILHDLPTGMTADGLAAVANSEATPSGSETRTALYSPRFRLDQQPLGDLRIDFRYMMTRIKPGTLLRVEYLVAGADWMPLETYGEVPSPRDVSLVLEASRLEGKDWVQIRWFYHAKHDFYVMVDNISIYAGGTGQATIRLVSQPEGQAVFSVDGQKVSEFTRAVGELPPVVYAVVEPGYRFAQWSTGSTENPLRAKLPVLVDETWTAILASTQHANVSYSCVPAEGGRILREGTEDDLTGVSEVLELGKAAGPVKAVPGPGFRFVRWNENGATDPSNHQVLPTADMRVEAVFARILARVRIIVQSQGAALPGVDVMLGGQIARTDQDGRAEFQLPSGVHELSVGPDGFLPERRTLEVTGEEFELTLSLSRRTGQSLLFAVSLRDEPAAGVKISIPEENLLLETDSWGRAQAYLPAGEYDFTLEHHLMTHSGHAVLEEEQREVVAVELAAVYALTFNEPANGTLAVKAGEKPVSSGDLVFEGSEVTVTLTPSTGYQLKSLMAGTEDVTTQVEDGKYSFTMPGEALELTATFAAVYALTFNEPANGTLAAKAGEKPVSSGDLVFEGSEVTVTLTPSTGYQLKSLMAATEDVTAQVVDGKYTFTMPGEALELTATFEKGKYQLTLSSDKNGTLSSTPAPGEVTQGTTVTVTAKPKKGFVLSKLTVADEDVTAKQKNGKYEFEMPAKDVTVTAAFKKDPNSGQTAVERVILAEVTLAPNPCRDVLVLRHTEALLVVRIADLSGRTLLTERNAGASTMQLNVAQLPAGMYLVQLEGPHGVRTERIVKVK